MNDQLPTIRSATPRDAGTVRRLAELDSAPALEGTVLLAELNGMPVAAVSLKNGAVTADPFRPTEDVVGMLKRRRYQILRQGRDVGPARAVIRRLAAPNPAP
jgi:hypothetical protein